jgi:hypothetical protein
LETLERDPEVDRPGVQQVVQKQERALDMRWGKIFYGQGAQEEWKQSLAIWPLGEEPQELGHDPEILLGGKNMKE